MIMSTAAGRMRIRDPRLKSKAILSVVEAALEQDDMLTNIRTNRSAASIVVHFSADDVDVEALETKLMKLVDGAKKQVQANKGVKRDWLKVSKQVNQVSKVGMMASMAGSLAFAAAGKKTPHIYLGYVFLGFTAVHMLRHKQNLLR